MISIRTLITVGISTFLAGVLMQPVMFQKPPTVKTFLPEGRADRVQNPPAITPPPQFGSPEQQVPRNPTPENPTPENLAPETPSPENIQSYQNSIEDLQNRKLLLPVEGIQFRNVKNSFYETRGDHTHEAVDILAPRDTPVVAVEDGKIAKLFYSVRGGITIYHFDPTETYCYYYAHLDRYAVNIREGQYIKKGQVIGYVGISGNAPKDTPHLHFAIFKLNPDKRWWQGTPIDPYPLLANR